MHDVIIDKYICKFQICYSLAKSFHLTIIYHFSFSIVSLKVFYPYPFTGKYIYMYISIISIVVVFNKKQRP